MIDEPRAFRFLEQSRSRFVRVAAEWLRTVDDPVDVLLLLSHQTGEALGPWETFRFCALLGLSASEQVRELGLDVLVEPPERNHPAPPIAHAFALAHAHAIWPDEPTPFAAEVLALLDDHRGYARAHPDLICAAELALAGPAGAAMDDGVAERALEGCEAGLVGDDGGAVAGPVLEAAILGEASAELAAQALHTLGERQRSDGGLPALDAHPILVGYVTLRALSLQLRLKAGTSNPSG